MKKQIGKTVSVLIEGKPKDGEMFGYTPNYTPVKVMGNARIGSIVDVLITDYDADFCIGKLI
ncbi:MAG: TRAM domain-containing protein [Candidatus Fimenecus sp.]